MTSPMLMLIGRGPEWQEHSACASSDGEAFHPQKGGSVKMAKRVCSGCEVRAECLEYALATDQRFGVWGGMSENERNKELKRRRTAAADLHRSEPAQPAQAEPTDDPSPQPRESPEVA
jgi:hypothetical protein